MPEFDHRCVAWTTSRRGQDSPWKSQSEWQRTGINGERTSMVWPTLGRGRLKNRTVLRWIRVSVQSINSSSGVRRVCCWAPAGRRYRSIAGAGAQHQRRRMQQCGQCHVVSRGTKLNTDLFQLESALGSISVAGKCRNKSYRGRTHSKSSFTTVSILSIRHFARE